MKSSCAELTAEFVSVTSEQIAISLQSSGVTEKISANLGFRAIEALAINLKGEQIYIPSGRLGAANIRNHSIRKQAGIKSASQLAKIHNTSVQHVYRILRSKQADIPKENEIAIETLSEIKAHIIEFLESSFVNADVSQLAATNAVAAIKSTFGGQHVYFPKHAKKFMNECLKLSRNEYLEPK